MAPYIGLLDENGREISGKGYHRLDLSEISFKITVPRDEENWHVRFINVTAIVWPTAGGRWSARAASLAIYAEPDSKDRLCETRLRDVLPQVRAGDHIRMSPGDLTLDVNIRSKIDA